MQTPTTEQVKNSLQEGLDLLKPLRDEVRVELHHTHTGEPFFAQLTRAEANALTLAVGDVVWVLPIQTIATEEAVPALVG
jgi:ABC-type molybdate transport system ATPase subunit